MNSKRTLNRRQAVGLSVGAAISASRLRSHHVAAQTPQASAAANVATEIVIPEPITELPTEDVTYNWLDSGDAKAFFWNDFATAYNAAHPNITFAYQGLPWNEIQKVVPLGIQNNNAPDVFQLPSSIPSAQAVNEGWVSPLDEVLPNLDEVKARFPDGTFVPGITDFNGKTYMIPLTSLKRHGQLLLYNRQYFEEAGLEVPDPTFTWDGFREAAKKLTEQGKGNYYGLVVEGAQVARFAAWVNSFARAAGKTFGLLGVGDVPIDWKTGELLFTSDEHLAAIDLLMGINADGSIFPGSLSLNAPQARARVPEGGSAMIIQGPWNVAIWHKDNPDFKFGVANTPVQSEGINTLYHVPPGGDNPMWTYAQSKNKAITGDVLNYVCSLEGQQMWAQKVGIADMGIFPEVQGLMGDDPETQATIKIFEECMRVGPEPRAKNVDFATVYQNITPVQPDFGTIMQGIFAGQIPDAKQAMQDLQDSWNAELDSAIEKAKGAGANVSRDDMVFADWDPTVDYTNYG